MPLPSDEKLIALGEQAIAQLEAIFGQHSGFRPAHARGVMLSGNFTPTSEASKLSNAPHFTQPTPVTVRFSSSTGVPEIPDTDPNANPRGLAIRFNLGGRSHTDIIAHSTAAFPVRTGPEFLEFLGALASSGPGTPSPTPIEAFLKSHPAAYAFVQTPKPPPSSLAREAYFALNAFKFINGEGNSRYGRYIIVPDAGIEHLHVDAIKSQDPNYLYDELPRRLSQGPISFKLQLQLAEEGDNVDDVTVHWPRDRTEITLGNITLDNLIPDSDAKQKHIIFDPIPRVQGIEPSDDPLLEFRAAVYLISGRRRRAA